MKRPSDSAREAITESPRRRSSSASAGRGSRETSASRLPAIDLMGASELLSSWPITRMRRCHAARSSSRSARLTSESTTRRWGLPPWRNVPSRTSKRPGAARERGLDDAGRLAVEDPGEADPLGLEVHQPLDRLAEERLARAVGETQPSRPVEREHRHVDLAHHALKERRRLERAEPLLAQGLGERVQLAQRVAERPVVAAGARAEREVALAQRAEQVRQRLQGPHDRLARGEREEHPARAGEEAQRPPRLALERRARARGGRGRSRAGRHPRRGRGGRRAGRG